MATRSPRNSLRYSECQSVAFSPDGRILASAHQGGDVVLWDARDGRQLGLLKGHRDQVDQVVFSPDGRSLATAGKDKTVKLWSLATRRQTARATLKGDLTPVWSVAYSPDGKTLAVADGPIDTPGTVTLWDLATRKVKATLRRSMNGASPRSSSRPTERVSPREAGTAPSGSGTSRPAMPARAGRAERRHRAGVLARRPAAGLGGRRATSSRSGTSRPARRSPG